MTMADVSHIGGLIAGGVMSNPCVYGFDFVTPTTPKSQRGPRGGMILTKKDFRRKIDSSVFPGPARRPAHESGGGRGGDTRQGT